MEKNRDKTGFDGFDLNGDGKMDEQELLGQAFVESAQKEEKHSSDQKQKGEK